MKKIITIFALASLVFVGCTKLEEEIYDKLPGDGYPENASQVATLTVDSYKRLQNLVDDNGWWFLAQELSSDGFCAPTRASDWFDGGKWLVMHQHNWSNDVEGINRMWGTFWEGIIASNGILDKLRKLEQNDNTRGKIAEVEVMRSFYYYLLMDNYGSTPYIVTADLPGDFLPLKVPRTEIYDSLIATIERSLPYLRPIDNKLLATRYMAFALLSKLYINSEVYTGTPQWAKAEMYIDSVLAGPFRLESDVSATFKTNNDRSSEIIFSIPYDEDNFQGFRIHMRTLHYQHNLTYDMPVGPWNGFAAVPTFFDTYEDTDLRKQNWFIYGPQYTSSGAEIIESITGEPLVIDPYLPALFMEDGAFTPKQIRTTGARAGKYEIKMGAKENLSNNFPLFRLTDFYLMKAETVIRQGGNGDEWINPIRERADVAPWSGATIDQLLAERGRELWLEGHRRQDLIRYGKWENAWWEKPATDGSKRTFPIPKWAIDANPNLGI
ncbi:MAG: RagB/SusD family nutrient uptake outer membrane protein [Bacteroidales bacterium]|nr:RagB/SusD family nutrient uptake outer membrane protein [Bacteroidales bacterium]